MNRRPMSWDSGCGNAGPWKPWKTAAQFPTAPTALGNRYAIPTFPQPDDGETLTDHKTEKKGDQRILNSCSSGSSFDENMVARLISGARPGMQ